MYVNILIIIVYTSNYQPNAILYENMRNDFAKSFLVLPYTSSHTGISIPLYTTTILCNFVVPTARFTVSVSA